MKLHHPIEWKLVPQHVPSPLPPSITTTGLYGISHGYFFHAVHHTKVLILAFTKQFAAQLDMFKSSPSQRRCTVHVTVCAPSCWCLPSCRFV
mmetsp:Transcript_72488/g.121503  ORF Transcript_72488/g.121503 Transcript_72488/m.121503 type:complete len:92 (-) Transcript_72488:1411-1686(-)